MTGAVLRAGPARRTRIRSLALLAPLAAGALVMLAAAMRGLTLPWTGAGLALAGNVLGPHVPGLRRRRPFLRPRVVDRPRGVRGGHRHLGRRPQEASMARIRDQASSRAVVLNAGVSGQKMRNAPAASSSDQLAAAIRRWIG